MNTWRVSQDGDEEFTHSLVAYGQTVGIVRQMGNTFECYAKGKYGGTIPCGTYDSLGEAKEAVEAAIGG